MKSIKNLFSILIVFTLISCGGGGSGGNDPENNLLVGVTAPVSATGDWDGAVANSLGKAYEVADWEKVKDSSTVDLGSNNYVFAKKSGSSTQSSFSIIGPLSTGNHYAITRTNPNGYDYVSISQNNGAMLVLVPSNSSFPVFAIKKEIPSVPTNLLTIPSNNSVSVIWNSVLGATNYKIYSSTTLGQAQNGALIGTVSNTSYHHTNLQNDITYYYAIKASNSMGDSAASTEVSATPTSTSIDAPQNVKATAYDGYIWLSWSSVSGASYYKIYYSTTSGQGKSGHFLTDTSGNVYYHSPLTNGITYHYVITAVNANGESDASEEVSATPKASIEPPNPPTNVSTTPGDRYVNISWDSDTINSSSNKKLETKTSNRAQLSAGIGALHNRTFNIYYSTVSGKGTNGMKIPNVSNPFKHVGLDNDKTYYYVVTESNGAGESAASEEVSATPKASNGLYYWKRTTTDADWSARHGHTSVFFNNKLWVLGGWDGTSSQNDVWSSSDGINWSQQIQQAPSWVGRDQHTSVVFNDKLWVIGGWDTDENRLNDVWSFDGINWSQQTQQAPWSARYGHTSVVFNNELWVIGGWDTDENRLNDVWSSSDGITWSQQTQQAPWGARYGHTSVVFDNKIWVIGGWDGTSSQNDVWSSPDGENWTQHTQAPWGARYGHTSVVFDNKLWVIGGYTGFFSKDDVWSFDGTNWSQQTQQIPWKGRDEHTSVVYNNKLWVLGGWDTYARRLNDVWYYDNTTASVIPQKPTNVSAITSSGSAKISWDSDGFATSSNLYYSTVKGSGKNGTKLTNISSPITLQGLANNMTYYAVVTGVNSVGESELSDEISFTPISNTSIPNPPINVVAASGVSKVTISWTGVSNANSYNLYYSNSSGNGLSGTKISGITSTTYTHNELNNEATYYYVVTAVNSAGESTASTQVSATPNVITGTDPYAQYQWHLSTSQITYAYNNNTVNTWNTITAANNPPFLNLPDEWSDHSLTGSGVRVIAIDDGLDINHPDLFDNTRNSSLNCDYVGNFGGGSCSDRDPTPNDPSDSHGTMVSGIIGAVANDIGVRSLASGSQLGGHNYLLNQYLSNWAASLLTDSDIVNMSIGSSYMDTNNSIYSLLNDAFKSGAEQGRAEKGRIYVKAAGNSFYSQAGADCFDARTHTVSCGNASVEDIHQIPYQIVVAAMDHNDTASYYSSAGSSVWISAYGGNQYTILTTHPQGVQRYDTVVDDTGNYTTRMNGTSSATPMISGIVALMLEANPELTWRQVKYILAKTAFKVHSDVAAADYPNSNNETINIRQPWITNAAGFNFHNWYGFGKVDATAAIDMARGFKNNPNSYPAILKTVALQSETNTTTHNQTIGTKSSNTFNLSVSTQQQVEAIKFYVKTTGSEPATNLHITATSPSGTKSTLLNLFNGFTNSSETNLSLNLQSNAFYQEDSSGTWTIEIYNNGDNSVTVDQLGYTLSY